MITLKQIRYALAVAKTRHFKQAADACSVSQSALSTAIQELEQQLAITIFERNNKSVFITAAGQEFLSRATRIYTDVTELYQLTRQQQAPLSAPMKIGIIPTIAPYLLPKVMPSIRKKYPNFKMAIMELQSHQLVTQVQNGELDAAILALPFDIKNLLSFPFWQEDFYYVAHKELLAKQQQMISSDEIDLQQLMLLQDGHCLKDHALSACQTSGGQYSENYQATSLFTLVQMVAGKLGTTLVPEMALASLVEPYQELVAIKLNEQGPHRRIAFIIRPNFVGLNSIECLINEFKTCLEN